MSKPTLLDDIDTLAENNAKLRTALAHALERLEASQPAPGSATDRVCQECRKALQRKP